MTTLEELIAQRDALENQITDIRNKESHENLLLVKATIAKFGFTADDIFGHGKLKVKEKAKVAAKFVDPVTGATWTGRGVSPVWIKDQNRDLFLIKPFTAEAIEAKKLDTVHV